MKLAKLHTFSPNAKHLSTCQSTRASPRHIVIAVAVIAQLCLAPVNSNRCPVDAERFESLDNATCLPRDYRDINEPTVACSTAVTVLFSCRCKDYTGLPGGNSVKHPGYCLLEPPGRTGEYTAALKLGVCIEGRCESSTFATTLPVDLRDVVTAERLNMPPLPACSRDEVNVKDMFRPLASCEFYCENRDNKPVNDGSPCVLEWSRMVFGRSHVQLTGQCWNGTCKFPEPFVTPMGLGCIDKELLSSQTIREPSPLHSAIIGVCFRGRCAEIAEVKNQPLGFTGEKVLVGAGCIYVAGDQLRERREGALCVGIVSKCTFQCGRGTQKRANGVTCLIREPSPLHRAIIGVCFRGRCVEIAEVKNQPLGFTGEKVLVGAGCIYVAGDQLRERREGALCVFTRSRFTGAPQLLGYCSRGNCERMRPFRPPPQVFKHKDCKVRDVRLTNRLYIAESCMATCRNYKTEPRYDGIPCLFRYRTSACYVFQTCRTYTIGQCYRGHCIRTSNSWDMHI